MQATCLILPITNVSGKGKHATVELRELFDPELVDAQLLMQSPELGNLRNLRVINTIKPVMPSEQTAQKSKGSQAGLQRIVQASTFLD